MKCRLRHNLIAGGAFHQRDSIIDSALLPEHLKNDPAFVSYDLAEMGGQVMLLWELNFTRTEIAVDGVATTFPEWRSAGELVPKEKIPGDWREGEDYLSHWTPEQRREVQEKENEAYLKQFQSEPIETYDRESHAVAGYQSERRRVGK